MVAYEGFIQYESNPAALRRVASQWLSGESVPLMRCHGDGILYLADYGANVVCVPLNDENLSVNATNVLAFDAGIDWDIKRVEGPGAGAGALAGGLFNMALSGSGWVAIVSDGPPVLLNTGEAPTFADPAAAITWASSVQTSIKTDIKLKNFIGKSSGESIQMSFAGQGWVLVQPSEGRVSAVGAGGSGAGGLLGNLSA